MDRRKPYEASNPLCGTQKPQLPSVSGPASGKAARWLLGRIKDGSQRALLLQQTPCIAQSLVGAPIPQSERPGGASFPFGRAAPVSCGDRGNGNAPQWSRVQQSLSRPPSTQGEELHSEPHSARIPLRSSEAPPRSVSSSYTQAAASYTQDRLRDQREASRLAATALQAQAPSDAVKVPYGSQGDLTLKETRGFRQGGVNGPCQGAALSPPQAAASLSSSSSGYQGLRAIKSHLKDPWESTSSVSKQKETEKLARLVVRTALPSHWQQHQQLHEEQRKHQQEPQPQQREHEQQQHQQHLHEEQKACELECQYRIQQQAMPYQRQHQQHEEEQPIERQGDHLGQHLQERQHHRNQVRCEQSRQQHHQQQHQQRPHQQHQQHQQQQATQQHQQREQQQTQQEHQQEERKHLVQRHHALSQGFDVGSRQNADAEQSAEASAFAFLARNSDFSRPPHATLSSSNSYGGFSCLEVYPQIVPVVEPPARATGRASLPQGQMLQAQQPTTENSELPAELHAVTWQPYSLNRECPLNQSGVSAGKPTATSTANDAIEPRITWLQQQPKEDNAGQFPAALEVSTAAAIQRSPSSYGSEPQLIPHHGALFGTLSPEQRAVVTAPPQSSVCVLAGPGADVDVLIGKTTTITARIVRLLLEGHRPLAALTFTKKSATELERRIRGGLEGVLRDRSSSACSSFPSVGEIGEKDLFVGTFHSFFMKLLKSHGAQVGVPCTFRVMGQFQQLALLRSLIEREKRAEAQRRGVPGVKAISTTLCSNPGDPHVSSDENECYSDDERDAQESSFQTTGMGGFSSTGKEADELRKRIRCMKFIPELLERERAAGSVLYRLFCEYAKHLKEQQPPLLDFADLTVKTLKLLERQDTRAELGALWPYLVVDEFQDTNSNQFKFICLMALQRPPNPSTLPAALGAQRLFPTRRHPGGVTVVGDDDQSIYKWRGTHTGIFHEFRRNFPEYKEFFLACNYRSVPSVVRHSLSLVSFNWPFRIRKALYSVYESRKMDPRGNFCAETTDDAAAPCDDTDWASTSTKSTRNLKGHVHGAFLPSQSLEAQYILRYILCLKQHHSLRWDDFAILCRTNSALIDIQNLLTSPRIQRAACAASAVFSTNEARGAVEDSKHYAGIGDPNKPADPAVMFPAANLAELELPAGGLPISSTSSKRAGGAEIFLRPDAIDLLCYLRLAVDPHHDPSFIRVLNKPPRRIGPKTLLALKRIQNSLNGSIAGTADIARAFVEMPWQGLPWGAQSGFQESPVTASLFDAMCGVLRAAGMKDEVPEVHLTNQSAAEVEAARLRSNQLEALASFVKSIQKLHSMSKSADSVKTVLEYTLGPLGMGAFFAHKRLVHRSRNAGQAAGEGTTEVPVQSEKETLHPSLPEVSQTKSPTTDFARAKTRRNKRKAASVPEIERTEDSMGKPTGVEASLRDLSKLYGSETFADVLGLLRAVEAYAPNWQQVTAADCIKRLLRDADSGRFVQQKVTNAVTLSTIHQAKGLEWKVVIVARANDGTLPMGVGGSQPLADYVARLLSSFAAEQPKPEALQHAEATVIRQASGNEQHFHLMEERRVCYVALTRARQFLLLTAPLADKTNHPLNPSRFFKEAGLVSVWQAPMPSAGARAKSDKNSSSLKTAMESGEGRNKLDSFT